MVKKSLHDLSDEELWQLFPIILSDYKGCWTNNYISEQKKLVAAIGHDNTIRISHIGSTSVLGLLSKPTIDILLEIKEEVDVDWFISIIESQGYIYSPQPQNPPPRMMFLKGYTLEGFREQAYHLHIRYSGDWDELYFRDYLTLHPEAVRKYGELKLRLQKQFEHDRNKYTAAKTEFIKEITDLARLEFPDKYKPR